MFWLASFLRVLCLFSREECRESQVAFSRKEETVFCNRYDWSIVWSCDPDHVKAKQETPFPILKERTRGGKTVLACFLISTDFYGVLTSKYFM